MYPTLLWNPSPTDYVLSLRRKMTKLRKIALIGIGVVLVATIGLKIAGIYPGIVAVHALPFCMMLIIDLTRKKEKKDEKPQE